MNSPNLSTLSLPILESEQLAVQQLRLSNFRNYKSLDVIFDNLPIVLYGSNGAGKTNILEAISLLSPGKGLRGASLDMLGCQDSGNRDWAIASVLQRGDASYKIGTGNDRTSITPKRHIKIDGKTIKSQMQLAQLNTVMWLIPQMDGLFLASASHRRKFLDRIVYHFDSLHGKRMNQYEKLMRDRNRLLKVGRDMHWISALEKQMAELSVAIAAARNETMHILSSSLEQTASAFPVPLLSIVGDVEQRLLQDKALDVEEYLIATWQNDRQLDTLTGRTRYGVHRSDMEVFYESKSMPADQCSTGEQKALLLSIILAEARAKIQWYRTIPIILLDEVVAHLDTHRRAALIEEILAMRAQTWMTGTDLSLFDAICDIAQVFHVQDGMLV